jgi:SAM-dependent methyltransferase
MPKVAQFLPDAKFLKRDKGVDLGVYQCSGCGLVQLDSRPVPYYKEVIRAAGISEEMRSFRSKQFSAFVSKFSLKNKKVLEIGCGSGEYLSIMQQAGVIAYGLEHSNRSVKQCAKNGLKAIRGFIQSSSYKIKHAPFDAFFMLNFLEHLPDPNSTLRGIYRNLADGGVGIVEVPNLDMILRNKLFSEFMRDHLCYFTRDTLILLLELNGFEVIECKEAWYEYTISAVVKKRRKADMTGFSSRQTQLKNELARYTRRFKDKGIAIWGAGHQALAAISLLGLANKIKYVVDSAPSKQGKFTPATHLRIVAPDMLKKEPVAAVIIMAASYSDEVAGILRDKFSRNKTLSVSILRANALEIVNPKEK